LISRREFPNLFQGLRAARAEINLKIREGRLDELNSDFRFSHLLVCSETMATAEGVKIVAAFRALDPENVNGWNVVGARLEDFIV
jgi:hypothetical protein